MTCTDDRVLAERQRCYQIVLSELNRESDPLIRSLLVRIANRIENPTSETDGSAD